MTRAEVDELLAFNELEPVGETTPDRMMAVVAATVAQSRGARMTADDFLPMFRRAVRRRPDKVLKARLFALVDKTNGKVE